MLRLPFVRALEARIEALESERSAERLYFAKELARARKERDDARQYSERLVDRLLERNGVEAVRPGAPQSPRAEAPDLWNGYEPLAVAQARYLEVEKKALRDIERKTKESEKQFG